MEILKREVKIHFSTKLFTRSLSIPQFYFSSRVLASFFSTKSRTRSSFSSSKKDSTLCKWLEIEKDPKASVVPVLDRWISEGNTVEKHGLQYLVWLMKQYRRYNHALEISHWMTDCRYFTLSPSDVAVRLALIQRVHGLEHVEAYFKKLSDKLKTSCVYGALLCCYVQGNFLQKAEAIMQEMREKGMATWSFPYNILINLYSKDGQFDKIETLIQEMEGSGIPRDKYTMLNLMTAYVDASNIAGMEKILNWIELDPQLGQGWKKYSVAANGYLKVGLIETALTMLRKIERMMSLRSNTLAFNYLLTQYAETGRTDELYRVWNTYKPSVELKHTTFCCMINSLSKLEDIEGAEKIFEEWESWCTEYDFRVLNKLLVAYIGKGLLENAVAVVEKAVEQRSPYASTWMVLAKGYIKQNQMSKGVEMLKRAISVSREGWRPNSLVLTACLDYLEAQGDVEGMEEVMKSLKSF